MLATTLMPLSILMNGLRKMSASGQCPIPRRVPADSSLTEAESGPDRN
jgi:hypothetical protein